MRSEASDAAWDTYHQKGCSKQDTPVIITLENFSRFGVSNMGPPTNLRDFYSVDERDLWR